MKSNVCKIEKGSFDLAPILSETEKVTEYNGLSAKDALRIRLLAEELVSMLPAIVKNFDGEFWLENDGNDYELHVKMAVDRMDLDTRNDLIKVSKENKNASAVGITGKICAVFDYMALSGDESIMMPTVGSEYGFASNVDFSYLWSLRQYQESVPQKEKEKWDEFEKSIIAKLADDVIVGVRGKKVNIVIKKKI